MEETRSNPLIELKKQIKELSDGLCEIGPGPYGIGASAIPSSEIGFYLIFNPKCYAETEIFPQEISEYSVTVEGFYHSNDRTIEPEELEKLAESENPDTKTVAKVLKELAGQIIKASREECMEAFSIMADEIREELEQEAVVQKTEIQSGGLEMTQQL